MDYLYRALKRETGETVENDDAAHPAAAAVPVTSGATDEAPAPQPIPHRSSGAGFETPVAKTTGETFHPDVVTGSPAVREHPERFYSFSAERMTKDRILALEQIRVLRSRVMELMRVQGLRTLLITSSVAEEGKSITAINLSLALSQVQSLRLLLIDADLRKPSGANVLGVSNQKGLLSYLLSETSIDESIQHLNTRLSFMPAAKAQNSVELLHSARMKELLRNVRDAYSLVIIDAPPLYAIADAQILANYADATVLCIRAGRTPREMVAESASMVSEKLVGTILVGSKRQTHGYSYTYSRYSGLEEKSK